MTLPNSSSIKVTHCGELTIAVLSKKGRTSEIFPGLTQYALISTGKLCNDGCEVNFDRKIVFVTKNEQTIMIVKRNTKNRMYEINFSDILLDNSLLHSTLSVKPSAKQANNLYYLTKMKDIITYLH